MGVREIYNFTTVIRFIKRHWKECTESKMYTTIRIKKSDDEKLARLRLSTDMSVADVISHLLAGVPNEILNENDRRIEDFYEGQREAQRALYRQELHDKIVKDTTKDADNRKALGLDAEAGSTTPAWGNYKKEE
jgi:hypothetical protein